MRIEDKDDLADADYIVRWDEQATRVTHYNLSNGVGGYLSGVVAGFTSSYTETYTEISVNHDAQRSYRVRACNEAGCSQYSTSINAKVLPIPEQPLSISVPSSTFGAFTATINFGDGLVQETQLQHAINEGDWSNTVTYTGKQSLLPLMRQAYTCLLYTSPSPRDA